MQTPNSEFSLLKLRRRFSRCKTASQTDVRGPKEVVKTASSLASSRLEWGVGDRDGGGGGVSVYLASQSALSRSEQA